MFHPAVNFTWKKYEKFWSGFFTTKTGHKWENVRWDLKFYSSVQELSNFSTFLFLFSWDKVSFQLVWLITVHFIKSAFVLGECLWHATSPNCGTQFWRPMPRFAEVRRMTLRSRGRWALSKGRALWTGKDQPYIFKHNSGADWGGYFRGIKEFIVVHEVDVNHSIWYCINYFCYRRKTRYFAVPQLSVSESLERFDWQLLHSCTFSVTWTFFILVSVNRKVVPPLGKFDLCIKNLADALVYIV